MSTWKQEKPTEAGAYWLKGNVLNNPDAISLVRVDWYDGELSIVDAENVDEHRADFSAWRNDFFWQGPLKAEIE